MAKLPRPRGDGKPVILPYQFPARECHAEHVHRTLVDLEARAAWIENYLYRHPELSDGCAGAMFAELAALEMCFITLRTYLVQGR